MDARQVAWADPSSTHAEGRAAAELLDRATATLAHRLGARADAVVWTSSGTEAVALAVGGSALAAVRRGDPRRHLVVTAVEHSSVLRTAERLVVEHGFDLTVVDVDGSGRVDPEAVRAALRPQTLAVHVQAANHEVGTLQPTHEVAAICRARDVLVHVDACQTIGQLGVTLDQVGADLLTGSAVKFGGPPGVGFVVLGPAGRLSPVIEGDDRQRHLRAGRVDVPAIAATAVALEDAAARMTTERSHREGQRRWLREAIADAVPDVAVHGPLAEAHPGIVACSALYVEGETLRRDLDTAGFAVHSGSSCATRDGAPSHVLMAMRALTHGHVRVSIGPTTTRDDLERFVTSWADTVTTLRRLVR